MKRNLVFVSFLLVFGLLGAAGTAFAQSTVFGVSSSIDQVRFEGTKEATGQVVLTSSSNGVVKGSGTVGSQTIITLTYGANLAVAVGNANVSCNATPCVGGTNFSVTGATGQPVVKITFLTDVSFSVGNTMTISGIRVNANAFGSSGSINATAAAVVPSAFSATNAVTFSTSTTVSVANVNPKALNTTLSVGPAAFLSCVKFVSSTPDVELTVKENFAQALTSLTDENGLSGSGATNGSNILVTFTGVPNGVAITNSAITPSASLTIALDGTTPAAQTAAAANATLTFLFDVKATDTTAIEKVKLDFTISTPSTLPTGLTPNAITANVALTSMPTPSSTTDVPFFIDPGTNLTAVGISDCITNLLFPWIVADAPGGTFDTGIALANTTKDVFTAGGAVAQSGSCALTGFKMTDGSTVTTSVGPISAGATGTVVLSTVPAFAGFRGYVIAVCQFQNAHAFAFITQNNMMANGTSQGYLALVIPNPALVKRNPAGGGSGEALEN